LAQVQLFSSNCLAALAAASRRAHPLAMPMIVKAGSAEGALAKGEDAGEAKTPLMASGESLVTHLENDGFSVDAERLEPVGPGGTPAPGSGPEALATPPVELSVTLSDKFKPGESFTVQGPLGPIRVEPPPEAEPGMSLRYRLAPRPDFRVQVPPGARPGSEVKFEKADGVEVCVCVPEGLGPGDAFEVTPPALMVKVPEGVNAGDGLVFCGRQGPNGEPAEWYRAKLPEGLEAGKYFTARLPTPKPGRRGAPGRPGGMANMWGSQAMGVRGLVATASSARKEGKGPLELLKAIGRAAFLEEQPVPAHPQGGAE